MTFCSDTDEWAKSTFGGCELGDRRRTDRVVDFASRLATNPKGSVNEVCGDDTAAAEGAYRLLRNEAVLDKSIDEGPFKKTAEDIAEFETVLAIQDTTTLNYSHQASKELGTIGGKGRGFVVHSTIAVNASNREVLGLLDQKRWTRKHKRRRKKTGKKPPYKDRESYKWEAAQRRISSRMKSTANVINVCDREADINEYLQYQKGNDGRFIIRASVDRCLKGHSRKLWDLLSTEPVLGTGHVRIPQRGLSRAKSPSLNRSARKARQAHVSFRARQVTLFADNPITVNAVYVRETHAPTGETPIEWMLLTTEPIDDFEQLKHVVDYYVMRWIIEDFHKAWKSGCGIEERRLQTSNNLLRLAAITAHVAVRLLQIRSLAEAHPDAPCDSVLSNTEWRVLFAIRNQKRGIPKKVPSIQWAMTTIAKLAGWRDSKRTGRIGWHTLWKGWSLLQVAVQGWELRGQP